MSCSIRSPRTRCVLWVSVFLFLVGCGGSPSGLTPGGLDEAATYSPGAFNFLDPHDAGFHPLGSSEFVAIQREEALAILASAPGQPGDAALFRDDIIAGGDFQFPGEGWLSHEFEPTGMATGDVDGDGCPEPIVAGIERDTRYYIGTLRIGEPDPIGGPLGMDHVQRLCLGPDLWPGQLTSVRVEAADVTGNGVAELLVAEQWDAHKMTRLTVLRYLGQTTIDGSPDFQTLYEKVFYSGGVWISPGQFDEDPAMEVLMTFNQAYGERLSFTVMYDDFNAEFPPMMSMWSGRKDSMALAPLVGQFDDDPLDEFILEESCWGGGAPRSASLVCYDWDGVNATPIGQYGYTDHVPWTARLGRGMIAADRDNDGVDEALWLSNRLVLDGARGLENIDNGLESPNGAPGCYVGNTETRVLLRSWEPLSDELESIELGTGYSFPDDDATWDLTVLDECGDGNDVVMACFKVGPTEYLDVRCVYESGEVGELISLAGTAESRPLLCSADFDDDGLRLRWNGSKDLELPTPIPVALISAPPTQAGILQNYDKSKSLFNTPASALPTMQLEFTTSVSLALDREISDSFGIVNVPECKTLNEACALSVGAEPVVLRIDEFNGSKDKDSVLFAGVLYQVYEYEIESSPNPDAVGGILSINVPVAARSFKWSRDFYADKMPFEYALPDDVFAHQIGAPASYPSKGSLMHLLSSYGGPYLGWPSQDLTTVMGGATHQVAIEMADWLPPGHDLDLVVEVNLELKAGGPLTGLTVGLFEPRVYSFEVLRDASFRGVIGDIHVLDWQEWYYDVGMVLYTRDLSGELPCQVLDYWTDPVGDLYE